MSRREPLLLNDSSETPPEPIGPSHARMSTLELVPFLNCDAVANAICVLFIAIAVKNIAQLVREMTDATNSLFEEYACTVTPRRRTTTSKYFATPTTSKFASAAIKSGFKQTRSSLPDLSDQNEMPVEYKTSAAVLQLTAQEWMNNMTDTMRHEMYLGNIPELVKHSNEKYPNGMSTRQVRAWLQKPENSHHVPKYLEGTNWAIDHIVSDSIGGISHPYNFFLLPRVLNNAFSGWATLEKRRCVGTAAWGRALDLQRWYSLKARALVDLSVFDPVTDHALVQRSR